MMEFSSCSKRAKTPAAGSNNNNNINKVKAVSSSQVHVSSSCLVDGCEADLGEGREYHRRHKVCEVHSKTPKVTIAGRDQRFCQQCSRFHSLEEFDQGKRSCRKRLDGHNRRRRKPPQSDSSVNSKTTATFLSTQPGMARIVSFNNSTQIHLSAVVGTTTTTTTGFKPDHPIGPNFNNQPPLNSNYITRHHLPIPPPPPPHNANNAAGRDFSFLQQRSLMPSSIAGNSHGALSLLSSHQTPSSPYAFAQLQEMHNHHQTMLTNSAATTLQFQGMFNDNHHAADSSSTGIVKQQTLSFRWD